MPNIISNTSCLILLSKSGMLNLLSELYGQIFISENVKEEFGENLPEFIEIKEVKNRPLLQSLQQILDLGEASTIALGHEFENCTLILDDMKARKICKDMGVKFTGTLGVLLKAKQRGIISSIKPFLAEMQKIGMWISKDVEQEILNKANED